jgi:hypothetical protein
VANSQLKARISELEVINLMQRESENRLRAEMEASRQNEMDLKRRLDELEALVKTNDGDEPPPSKRTRLSATDTPLVA